MSELIRIYVGYDSPNPVLLSTLTHSLVTHATRPLAITPISLNHLQGIFTRPREPMQSTEFSFTRFLVPYLAGYDGWAIYMDNDFLARGDIAELWSLRDDRYAVMCVQHNYEPRASLKFGGAVQTQYGRKNWSSLMLMNCRRCQALTVPYVNMATGLQLHQFGWLPDDSQLGSLPGRWNHLVGHDRHDAEARLVHFTEGGPYFQTYPHEDYATEWLAAFLSSSASGDSTARELTVRALDAVD